MSEETVVDQATGLVLDLKFANQTARFTRHSLPREDAEQEAAMAMMYAAQKFDPSRGVQFKTFARWVIQNRLRDKIPFYGAAFPPEYSRIESAESQSSPFEPEDHEALRKAMATLMPDVQKALALRFEQDLTFSAIGVEMGCSKSYAAALVAAGLTKLKWMLGSEQA